MKFIEPNRLVFQTPPEAQKTASEQPGKAPETERKPKNPEQEAVLRSVDEGRDQLADLRKNASERQDQLAQKAEGTEPAAKASPGTTAETPEAAAAGTTPPEKAKEKTDAEKAAEEGGPLGGALYKIFKRLGDKLAALFASLRLMPGAVESKKITDKLNGKTHEGFKDLLDRETVKKNLDDTAQTASSTVEYIGKMLGVSAAKDSEDLYLGLKNSRDSESKEKYSSTSSSNQKYPVGSILFFSAKLEGEKAGDKDTRHYGGKDVSKGLTHAAIVVKGGTLGELTLRFLNKDGYPKSEDATPTNIPFGTSGTPFGYENFVCALYSPKDLEAEEAEAAKPAEEETEPKETAVAQTPAAETTQTAEKPETAATTAEVQAAPPVPKAPETAVPETPSETQES